MANRRLELHEKLCEILGSRNVYFQPPDSIQMKYPAIRYELAEIQNNFADNQVYSQNRAYTITVIDKNPDSTIVDKFAIFPKCRFNRTYPASGLNHTVFTLYYY